MHIWSFEWTYQNKYEILFMFNKKIKSIMSFMYQNIHIYNPALTHCPNVQHHVLCQSSPKKKSVFCFYSNDDAADATRL